MQFASHVILLGISKLMKNFILVENAKEQDNMTVHLVKKDTPYIPCLKVLVGNAKKEKYLMKFTNVFRVIQIVKHVNFWIWIIVLNA